MELIISFVKLTHKDFTHPQIIITGICLNLIAMALFATVKSHVIYTYLMFKPYDKP